jgi:AcrR family transcriptional regulator
VVAAARRCLVREGARRTTVDEVAVEAGISRATLYRAFPGGRDTIFEALAWSELDALVATVRDAMDAAADLEAALAAGICAAAQWLGGHEIVATLMFDDPALLLTHLEFEQMDRSLAIVAERFGPLLERFCTPTVARRGVEFAMRLVLSRLLFPCEEPDLSDEAGAWLLAHERLVPALTALALEPSL